MPLTPMDRHVIDVSCDLPFRVRISRENDPDNNVGATKWEKRSEFFAFSVAAPGTRRYAVEESTTDGGCLVTPRSEGWAGGDEFQPKLAFWAYSKPAAVSE